MSYSIHRMLYEALEPVHIGAGGYRLGRVDKTICREPGTNLPKIPGTSLSGAAKSYAALLYGDPELAGNAPAPKRKCPISYTFGYATDAGGGSAGTVSVGDAYILLFPVHSIKGRVWVTTKSALEQWAPGAGPIPDLDDQQIAVRAGFAPSTGLNLGWLWFGNRTLSWSFRDWLASLPASHRPVPAVVSSKADSVILVPSLLFGPIVNSNLEVRTSVAIDPKTGTTAKSMLFSYEAIPRETVLFQEAVEDDYHDKDDKPWQDLHVAKELLNHNLQWKRPIEVLKSGLDLMGTLGVGGMGTRGFGRLKMYPPESPESPQ